MRARERATLHVLRTTLKSTGFWKRKRKRSCFCSPEDNEQTVSDLLIYDGQGHNRNKSRNFKSVHFKNMDPTCRPITGIACQRFRTTLSGCRPRRRMFKCVKQAKSFSSVRQHTPGLRFRTWRAALWTRKLTGIETWVMCQMCAKSYFREKRGNVLSHSKSLPFLQS